MRTCQEDSGFSAEVFTAVYIPGNNSLSLEIMATSSIQGDVIFDVLVTAYGFEVSRQTLDPCDLGLNRLCPMNTGKVQLPFSPITGTGDSVIKNIPSIAYSVPDLDATIRININSTDTNKSIACIEADFSNGKTVDLVAVKWATGIASVALVAFAIISGLGHTNAAHMAANSLALISYFQSLAIVGLSAVYLPPIAQAWTQDFQWSIGIIHAAWMQDIFTWYQRATGGTPSTTLDSSSTSSAVANNLGLSGVAYGIPRVAFKADIELTNLFMTGLTFFVIFIIFTILCVASFKGICELSVKRNLIAGDKFLKFRSTWFIILKGFILRASLIGFTQISILCLWELTQIDSPAEAVLAVFFFVGILANLLWGASEVVRNAHPRTFNKWTFLYIEYRASAYYFICPLLAYILLKGLFVALAQKSGITQAISMIIIEAGALIGTSVLRPWIDRSTNSFNISIGAFRLLNAIFLLIFSDVLGTPDTVVSIVGVLLFILNAFFSFGLLVTVAVFIFLALRRTPDDAHYHFMNEDRASTELDALAATARGDKVGQSELDLHNNSALLSSDDLRNQSPSPVNPSIPLFPAVHQHPMSPLHSSREDSGVPFSFPSVSPYEHNYPESVAEQNRAQNAAR